MITGVDLSEFQHPNGETIDYAKAVESGIEFAIGEFKDELGKVNPYFEEDAHGFRAAGAKWGSYVFVRPELDIAPQAEDLRALAKFGPVWADVEVTGGCRPPDLRKMWGLIKETAPECSLCSYPAYLRANGPFALAGHAWIDSFGAASPPPGAALWGMTDKAEVPGIPAAVDLDAFCGSRAQFDAVFEIPATPAAPVPAVIAASAATPSGGGYWLVTYAGRIFAFGDAAYHGSPKSVEGKVVSILSTPTGRGYRLVADTGQVLNYGDARPEVRVL